MATIHFYEKPGCVNNTKQKALLTKAGHSLVVYDLLQQNWQQKPEFLQSFFSCMTVADWFNPNAPAIKNGEIDSLAVNAEQAIALMTLSPLLIRRPLLEIDGQRFAGFDLDKIQSCIELLNANKDQDFETCPSKHVQNKVCLS